MDDFVSADKLVGQSDTSGTLSSKKRRRGRKKSGEDEILPQQSVEKSLQTDSSDTNTNDYEQLHSRKREDHRAGRSSSTRKGRKSKTVIGIKKPSKDFEEGDAREDWERDNGKDGDKNEDTTAALDIASYDIDESVRKIIKNEGIERFYPSQAPAIKPALDGKNLLLAMPTASGKSLVAYLALVHAALRRKKGVYLVPLKALASEKYEDLKKFEPLGIRIGISSGDLDADDRFIRSYDIVVTTSEKCDSLIRHNRDWLNSISILIADEIHLLNDPYRGPTLEVLLARFLASNPDIQLIALSATIKNSSQIAEWLNAVHIQSNWRPVKLSEGVFFDGAIYWKDKSVSMAPDGADPCHS
ncbi:MAG: DEAD/DEAH box helicase, partial [Thermoplasmata archaeon]